MLIFIIAVVVLIIIIAATYKNSNAARPVKTDYYTAAKSSLDFENKPELKSKLTAPKSILNYHLNSTQPKSTGVKILDEINRDRKIQSNNLYASIQRQHQYKSIKEIEDYICKKREDNDNYWGYNSMEYKILMERQRELISIEESKMQMQLAATNISELSVTQCIELIKTIKTRISFGYFTEELNTIEIRLHEAITEKYKSEIPELKYNGVKDYLKEIKRKYGFVPKELTTLGESILATEPTEIRLKRERKNIQTNLAKARKNGSTHLIIEFEELLIENTNQLSLIPKPKQKRQERILTGEPFGVILKRERKNFQTNLSKARKNKATHLIIEYEELLAKNTQLLASEKNKNQ